MERKHQRHVFDMSTLSQGILTCGTKYVCIRIDSALHPQTPPHTPLVPYIHTQTQANK